MKLKTLNSKENTIKRVLNFSKGLLDEDAIIREENKIGKHQKSTRIARAQFNTAPAMARESGMLTRAMTSYNTLRDREFQMY